MAAESYTLFDSASNLFNNARVLNKNAACLLTISDSFVTDEVTTALERQNSFTNMMKIALEAAVSEE